MYTIKEFCRDWKSCTQADAASMLEYLNKRAGRQVKLSEVKVFVITDKYGNMRGITGCGSLNI
jgi:hypothetical protein